MSAELMKQIMEQMEDLSAAELYAIESHAVTLRRSRPVRIGQAYEVSDFPKGELKEKVIAQIRILEEETVLYAKGIYESGTLTRLVDDDDKRRALQALAGMGCLVIETNRW